MSKSVKTIAALVTVCVAALGSTGCSTMGSEGIDYSSAESDQFGLPAGAPALLTMNVTKSWPMADAGRIQGMDTVSDGRLIAIAAPDVNSGAPGELMTIDTSAGPGVDPASSLYSIPFGAEYAEASRSSVQIAHGWAVATGPGGRTAVSTGSRFGVIADLTVSLDDPGNYFGLATDRPGSPITPVTGACWYPGVGDDAAGTMTAHGSNTVERRMTAAGPGDGRPTRVLMQNGPYMNVRENQEGIATEIGPAAPPKLAPAYELGVGGLTDLVCLDDTQVEQLHRAGVTKGLRQGQGASLLAVIDRQLADRWFTSGVDVVTRATNGQQARGAHNSGALVGQATGTGADRLDAVAIDTGTGVAVAGFQVRGEDVPEDAQVTSLTLDTADARRGWVTIEGQDRLYEFVIDMT